MDGEMKIHCPGFFQHKALPVLTLFLGIFLSACWVDARAASASTELKNMRRTLDRTLCQSVASAPCSRNAPRKQAKAKNVSRSPSQTPTRRSQKSSTARPVVSPAVPGAKAAASVPAAQDVSRAEANSTKGGDHGPENQIHLPNLKPKHLQASAQMVQARRELHPIPPKMKVVLSQVVRNPLSPSIQVVPHLMPDGIPRGEICDQRLAALGVSFERLPADVAMGACSVEDAVKLKSISVRNSQLKLPDRPTLTCGFALRFATWVHEKADPIIDKATGQTIASLGTGPGFQCRRRNGDSGAKMSEHAYGNAVDVERIRLSGGETIDVKDAISNEAKFQQPLAALRVSSCDYFTTVLGPGANAAHASHFHFDLQRRGKKGNHRICE
jgi:hypothetical protein